MMNALGIPGLPLSDAMTAADLYAWEQAIAAMVGPQMRVVISTSTHATRHVWASIYTIGSVTGADLWGEFHTTWAEAIRAAHAHARKLGRVRRNAQGRMALAIISLTNDHGTCTEAALIRRGFTAGQVATLHEAACGRAEVMCRDGRFVVVRAGLDAGDAL